MTKKDQKFLTAHLATLQHYINELVKQEELLPSDAVEQRLLIDAKLKQWIQQQDNILNELHS